MMNKYLVFFASCALGAGCSSNTDKPAGTGSFKELRAYMKGTVHPLAAEWQAAEARVASLGLAGEADRQLAAIADVNVVVERWQVLLADAPAPLPMKAPLATLRKALGLLVQATPGGRAKASEAVERALADISRRKVSPAPDPAVPLADAPYLVRMWRDVTSLRAAASAHEAAQAAAAQEAAQKAAEGSKTKRAKADGLQVEMAGDSDGSPDAEAPDPIAQLLFDAREAVSLAGTPAERMAHGLAVQLLQAADMYRRNPPQVDARTMAMYRMGQIGKEAIEEAVCRMAEPLGQRVAAVEQLGGQVQQQCALPGAGCSGKAADLAFHPLLTELKAVKEKALECRAARASAAAALAAAAADPSATQPPPADPADRARAAAVARKQLGIPAGLPTIRLVPGRPSVPGPGSSPGP